MSKNKKLAIFEALASLMGILAIIACAFPAYFEEGKADQSTFFMMKGQGLLIFAFVLLILGTLAAAGLSVLLFLEKSKKMLTMGGAIGSGFAILISGIILCCAIFVCGYDKLGSELGFLQGSWGIRVGVILIGVFALLGFALSYPAGLIVLREMDEADAAKKADLPVAEEIADAEKEEAVTPKKEAKEASVPGVDMETLRKVVAEEIGKYFASHPNK